MELTSKNIEEYIHRFMEGETNRMEEEAIYRFFHTADIPEHLKVYAPMFAWYEAGMPEDKGCVEAEKPVPVKKRDKIWKRIPLGIWSMGIAAMLVVGIGLGTLYCVDHDKSEAWMCYEGSYVSVNGKCITDVEQLMPCILETLAEADRIEKQIEERLEGIRDAEKEIQEKENILADD